MGPLVWAPGLATWFAAESGPLGLWACGGPGGRSSGAAPRWAGGWGWQSLTSKSETIFGRVQSRESMNLGMFASEKILKNKGPLKGPKNTLGVSRV